MCICVSMGKIINHRNREKNIKFTTTSAVAVKLGLPEKIIVATTITFGRVEEFRSL